MLLLEQSAAVREGTHLDGQGGARLILAGGGCGDAVVARRAAVDRSARVGETLVLRKQRLHVVGGVGKRPAQHTTHIRSCTECRPCVAPFPAAPDRFTCQRPSLEALDSLNLQGPGRGL
jgi:hypothetical protein